MEKTKYYIVLWWIMDAMGFNLEHHAKLWKWKSSNENQIEHWALDKNLHLLNKKTVDHVTKDLHILLNKKTIDHEQRFQ